MQSSGISRDLPSFSRERASRFSNARDTEPISASELDRSRLARENHFVSVLSRSQRGLLLAASARIGEVVTSEEEAARPKCLTFRTDARFVGLRPLPWERSNLEFVRGLGDRFI